MAIISADSSGIIRQDDIWLVAVKRNPTQSHSGIYVNRSYQTNAKHMIKDNWVEKLSAILYYKVINTIYDDSDYVQIDKDFSGKRAEYVRRYIDVLFLTNRRSAPVIEFLSYKQSAHIKEAHTKTKAARYKQIRVNKNPNITKEIECLKNYRF